MQKTIGSRLREIREKLGLDQKEFAAQLGIPRNSLHRYETDDQVPGGKVLARLAELNIDLPYLLAGATTKTPIAVTVEEMELLYDYRRSHKDVKKGVKALLKATAVDEEETTADVEIQSADQPK